MNSFGLSHSRIQYWIPWTLNIFEGCSVNSAFGTCQYLWKRYAGPYILIRKGSHIGGNPLTSESRYVSALNLIINIDKC